MNDMLPHWTEEAFLIWLAGFWDGEGSFQISRKHISERKNENYQIQMSVTNTAINVVEEIHDRLGGTMTYISGKNNNRDYARVTFYGDTARRIARLLMPYLRIKQQAAEAMLAMPIGNRWENCIESQRIAYETLKEINKRGKSYGKKLHCLHSLNNSDK